MVKKQHHEMKKRVGTTRVLCPAMKEAGITEPDSEEGIEFCLHCPYPDCIAFSGDRDTQKLRVKVAKAMAEDGISIEEIASALDISPATVEAYLKR